MNARALLLAVVAVAATLLSTASALAYPSMIREGYAGCSVCHTDPSGGSLLTRYGRAQSELLLSTRWGRGGDVDEEPEPSRFSQQFFGAPLPTQVDAGGDVRNGYMWNRSNGSVVDRRFLQMRADLAAQVRVSKVRLYGSLGYQREESARLSQRTWVTHEASWGNVVSREHWIGVDLGDRILVRAGRLMQPFGIRSLEHNAWVRSETQTDINQHQQHGVSFSYNSTGFRTEALLILGNYQVSPDAFRERGGAAYVEIYPGRGWTIGGSGKLTHAKNDLLLRTGATRQAYGVMSRVAPFGPVVLSAELDALGLTAEGRGGTDWGHASLVQLDVEPVSGVHLLATGETLNHGDGLGTAMGGWLSAWWFVISHLDVRFDFMSRTIPGSDNSVQTLLLQGHLYL